MTTSDLTVGPEPEPLETEAEAEHGRQTFVCSRFELLASFVVLGIIAGAWMVGLSQLKHDYRLSDGKLGELLTVSALIGLPVQLFSGAALHRWGRRVFPVTLFIYAAALVAIASIHTIVVVWLCFPIALTANIFYVISVNAAALHREHVLGERIMATLHAGFSGGGVPGCLLAGALLSNGVSLNVLYLVLAALLVGTGAALSRVTEGLASNTTTKTHITVLNKSLLREKGLLVVGAFLFIGACGEATMYWWTTVYLRDDLHAGALVGASGLMVFYATMAIGRVGVTPLQKRLERVGTLSLAGLVILLGMSVCLATLDPTVAIIGVLFTGLGYAVSVPLALSVGGSLLPGRSADVSGFLNLLLSVAFTIMPVVIGGLAAATSLRVALSSQLAIGLTLCAGWLIFRRSHLTAGLTD